MCWLNFHTETKYQYLFYFLRYFYAIQIEMVSVHLLSQKMMSFCQSENVIVL